LRGWGAVWAPVASRGGRGGSPPPPTSVGISLSVGDGHVTEVLAGPRSDAAQSARDMRRERRRAEPDEAGYPGCRRASSATGSGPRSPTRVGACLRNPLRRPRSRSDNLDTKTV